MRGLLYSFPVKLCVVLGAILAAALILIIRGFIDAVRGTVPPTL